MSMTDRLDPELAAPLDTFLHLTGGGLNLHDIPATRRTMDELAAAQMAKVPPITRTGRRPDLTERCSFRIYQPEERPDTLPALLWIHGGGYVLGSVERDDLLATPIWPKSRSAWWSRLSTGSLLSIPFRLRLRIVMPRSSGWRPTPTKLGVEPSADRHWRGKCGRGAGGRAGAVDRARSGAKSSWPFNC